MSASYEEKAQQLFGEVSISKGLVQEAGFGTRSIPAFVSEWIVTRNAPDGVLDQAAQERIRAFLNKHLPTRDQKEQLKNRLSGGETLTILDQYSIRVDLTKNEHLLTIPCLDDQRAGVEKHIYDQNPLLLGSGVWGVGKLQFYPPDHMRKQGQVWMVDFRPMQNARLDIDLYCECRAEFTVEEWRDLLIASMGYNPEAYTPAQQLHLLTRLVPLVQERVNMIELAPKGTGNSFGFRRQSYRCCPVL